jgi:hypothetical protein
LTPDLLATCCGLCNLSHRVTLQIPNHMRHLRLSCMPARQLRDVSTVAERAPDAVAAPSAQAAAAQAGAEISEGNPKEEFPNTSKRWEHGGAVQTYHGIDYPLVMHKFRPHVHKRALQQLSALHKRLRSRCLRQGSMLMVCKPAARLQLAAHYSQRGFFQDFKEILNKPNVFKLLASTI